MAGFPVLSTMQGRPASDLLYAEPHLIDCAGVVDSHALVPSLGSFSYVDNTEFQEQYASLFALRNNFQEDLDGFVHNEVVGNVNLRWDLSGWISSNNLDHFIGSSMFNDQPSLRLTTSQSSVSRTSNVLDQNSCSSKELSLSFGSQNPPNPTRATPGSMYLHIVQEILSQFASYTLQNLDLASYSNNRSAFMGSEVDGGFEVQIDLGLQKHTVESKKAQLMTLLQVVDDMYNQCIDEIHTVISAFHAATELDPQKHASFALRTVSFLYKNLRQRISNQILSMGADINNSQGKSDMSFEASFIQKQWSLQQQKRKEHQLWRPQRGLPEKSVSVLRAWMFQNFLHPYPKDAEKHLLAVKSGLSRSQVSNWFINARVRLWKPMIEEMYSELNKRKACDDRYEEGGGNMSHGSLRGMHNQI